MGVEEVKFGFGFGFGGGGGEEAVTEGGEVERTAEKDKEGKGGEFEHGEGLDAKFGEDVIGKDVYGGADDGEHAAHLGEERKRHEGFGGGDF